MKTKFNASRAALAVLFFAAGMVAARAKDKSVAHFQAMFQKADANADGEVTREEIQAANHRMSESKTDGFWARKDKDGNGTLNAAEFTAPAAEDNPVEKRAGKKIERPNIIFILGDDCGYHEFSFQGGTIPTPQIDSIAQGGVRLTQGYVSGAVCNPSRAGLLTGRYQQRFGFLRNLPFPKLGVSGLPVIDLDLLIRKMESHAPAIALG